MRCHAPKEVMIRSTSTGPLLLAPPPQVENYMRLAAGDGVLKGAATLHLCQHDWGRPAPTLLLLSGFGESRGCSYAHNDQGYSSSLSSHRGCVLYSDQSRLQFIIKSSTSVVAASIVHAMIKKGRLASRPKIGEPSMGLLCH